MTEQEELDVLMKLYREAYDYEDLGNAVVDRIEELNEKFKKKNDEFY